MAASLLPLKYGCEPQSGFPNTLALQEASPAQLNADTYTWLCHSHTTGLGIEAQGTQAVQSLSRGLFWFSNPVFCHFPTSTQTTQRACSFLFPSYHLILREDFAWTLSLLQTLRRQPPITSEVTRSSYCVFLTLCITMRYDTSHTVSQTLCINAPVTLWASWEQKTCVWFISLSLETSKVSGSL